jgi:tRNA-specific 2-thiouridylase
VVVGPRAALETRTVALRDVRLHRPGVRVTHAKLRYRSQPLRAQLPVDARPGRHATLRLELEDLALAPAPGQLACLMDGELVVGWATITT